MIGLTIDGKIVRYGRPHRKDHLGNVFFYVWGKTLEGRMAPVAEHSIPEWAFEKVKAPYRIRTRGHWYQFFNES